MPQASLRFKIKAIKFEEDGSAKIAVETPFLPINVRDYRLKFKGNENDLGYYVQYDGGYQSWSPTQAFEDGYTKI